MIFALTDETYSLVVKSDNDTDYCFYVSLLDQIYWVAGTLIGAWLGSAVSLDTKGVEFAPTNGTPTYCKKRILKNGETQKLKIVDHDQYCML